MYKFEILNALIAKNGYTSYLEIGIADGGTFRDIICENKIGVDPSKASVATIFKTSDDYFATTKLPLFDLVFVDGLHEADAVERDVINSLSRLVLGGTVCCHDILPTDKYMQIVPITDQAAWTGDCWRAFLKLRTEREDLEMCVVDSDWGVGIIRPGKQALIKLDKPLSEITYEDYEEHKREWLNVISVDEFQKIYLDE